MNKPKIGNSVAVGYKRGKITNVVTNNGNTLYIVTTEDGQVAVTKAGLEKSNELMSRKELNKQERAVDTRKPLPNSLVMAIKQNGDPIWTDASCNGDYDPDAWFLDHTIEDIDIPRLARALTMCGNCPLRAECLQVGLSESEINTGVWGGLLPGERIIVKYGAPRRSQAQRKKMEIAKQVRKSVNDFIHKQMRDGVMVLWSAK